ncbi:MAG: hypothetical protein FWE34_04200 [Defluviitaleaceae bacterium]|nr:hypothetical protein [Defluviitaleaceae bacterium]
MQNTNKDKKIPKDVSMAVSVIMKFIEKSEKEFVNKITRFEEEKRHENS